MKKSLVLLFVVVAFAGYILAGNLVRVAYDPNGEWAGFVEGTTDPSVCASVAQITEAFDSIYLYDNGGATFRVVNMWCRCISPTNSDCMDEANDPNTIAEIDFTNDLGDSLDPNNPTIACTDEGVVPSKTVLTDPNAALIPAGRAVVFSVNDTRVTKTGNNYLICIDKAIP